MTSLTADSPLIGEVRGWITRNWDPSATVRDWWRNLADAGWSFPGWPRGFGGRGLSSEQARIVSRQFRQAGVLGPPSGVGLTMGAPTLFGHGSPEQQQRLLPPLVRGETEWCQLFSEPDAGSDLASLRTRMIPVEGGWTVEGQKVWSSRAHQADWGMLLVRTDPTKPKHRGLSFVLIEMNQSGVEIRPLRQMNGECEFNEVFLSGAMVRPENVIGELGDGWKIAQTTLAHERAASRPRGAVRPGRAGMLDLPAAAAQTAGAVDDEREPYGRSGLAMARLADHVGRQLDPVLRDKIVSLHILGEVSKLTARRAADARKAGRTDTPEASILKLSASRIAHTARDVAFEIIGAHGMLAGAAAPFGGRVHAMALSAHKVSIGGGTDEIQRTIIAERLLGLPRDVDSTRDVPFQDVRRL